MERLSLKHWRPFAAIGISILTVTIFVSCSSLDSLLQTAPWTGYFYNPKGEDKAMKTFTNTKIEHINEGNFDQKVLQSAVPVLVDFYADWCGPCKALAPVLEEFSRENPDAKIVKVNVDENYELASRYEIESIPSLLVFKDNELIARHLGAADKTALKRLLMR
jgi:thioredoxin 1